MAKPRYFTKRQAQRRISVQLWWCDSPSKDCLQIALGPRSTSEFGMNFFSKILQVQDLQNEWTILRLTWNLLRPQLTLRVKRFQTWIILRQRSLKNPWKPVWRAIKFLWGAMHAQNHFSQIHPASTANCKEGGFLSFQKTTTLDIFEFKAPQRQHPLVQLCEATPQAALWHCRQLLSWWLRWRPGGAGKDSYWDPEVLRSGQSSSALVDTWI